MSDPRRAGALAAGLVFAADQASKWAVVAHFAPPGAPIAVTPFVNLTLVWNTGISFGLLPSAAPAHRWVLIAIAAAIAGGLGLWLWRSRARLPAVALGLVIGGALANIADRLGRGAVVDFLDFHVAGWHWPAFNLADSGISVGVALLVIDSLFGSGRSTKT